MLVFKLAVSILSFAGRILHNRMVPCTSLPVPRLRSSKYFCGSRDINMAVEKDSRSSLYERIRWSIYICLFLGYSSYYFCRKSYTFVVPALISELNIKKNELGVITSGFAAMYGIGKFSGGLLSDSLSPRIMFTTGMLLTGIINIVIGFTGNVWLLTFLWSVNGLAQGCGWPPCAKLLREWFAPYQVSIHLYLQVVAEEYHHHIRRIFTVVYPCSLTV